MYLNTEHQHPNTLTTFSVDGPFTKHPWSKLTPPHRSQVYWAWPPRRRPEVDRWTKHRLRLQIQTPDTTRWCVTETCLTRPPAALHWRRTADVWATHVTPCLTHPSYALIVCCTSLYLMYTHIVCRGTYVYTYCMLYVLALNVHAYCLLYVLTLNVQPYCMLYVLALQK